jgi:hypothetical protein
MHLGWMKDGGAELSGKCGKSNEMLRSGQAWTYTMTLYNPKSAARNRHFCGIKDFKTVSREASLRIPNVVLLTLLTALPAPGAPAQALVKPLWISVLPERAGRVYAMGLAPAASGAAQAVAQAGQNARAEVLARLRADVQAVTTVQSTAKVSVAAGGKATGSSEQHVGQDTRIQTGAVDLPGLAVEETWVDAQDHTAYALAYLDVPVAEGELRSRYQARKDDLAREPETPAAPRERLRMLGRLKQAQVDLARQDDLAALLAPGGGDPALRAQVRASRLAVERQMEQLRGSLSLGLEPSARQATQVAALLRNAALKAGLGWSETGGEFTLAMAYKSDAQTAKVDASRPEWNGWWRGGWVSHTAARDTGIVVARGVLELTLKDRAGNAYESVEIEAKGLGVSDFQAEQKLKEDFRKKLEKTFGAWLEGLVAAD